MPEFTNDNQHVLARRRPDDIHAAFGPIASDPLVIEREPSWMRCVEIDISGEDHFHRARASVLATVGGDANRTEGVLGERSLRNS